MAVPYYGDYPEDHVAIRIPVNTYDSNDPTASVTITNLADSDIHVHKDGGLTQIATDGASVVINFDGITGNHMILIDSSAHADYSTGSEYAVRIEGTTIDAGTINAWIGCFSIERAGGVLALLKGATGLAAIDTVVDGIQTDLSNGTDGLGAIKADTAAILTDTADIQPNYATASALATVDTVVDGIQTDLSNATDGLGAIKSDTAAILIDTAEIGTAGAGLTDITINAASVDLIWDEDIVAAHTTADTAGDRLEAAGAAADPWSTALPGAYGAGTAGNLIGNNCDAPISTVDTVVDGIQTDLSNGTDGLGAIKADTAAILTDTADIQPNYATSAELAKVPKSDGTSSWNATALAAINAEADTAISDAALATAANLATVDTNVDNLNLGIIYGATTGTPTTTSTNTDLTGYLDGELVGGVIVFTGGTADGQRAAILTYTATGGIVTFAALTTAPAASDTFKIV